MAESSNRSELSSDKECLQGTMFPAGKTYPLNSKRIVASQLQTLLQTLASLLDLPTGVSTSETRQLIKV